ncbi:hypothetical protein [Paracoccus fontiphilus]|uniref:Glutaredoxin n=1 Tax=Paracoccus fontiphilus TaxID=1815556 RepID=A0ABV7IHI1_9RHOB
MLDATAPAAAKTAHLYRMMMPDHTCPYGLKALDLLKRSGFAVECPSSNDLEQAT